VRRRVPESTIEAPLCRNTAMAHRMPVGTHCDITLRVFVRVSKNRHTGSLEFYIPTIWNRFELYTPSSGRIIKSRFRLTVLVFYRVYTATSQMAQNTA
jgi:hypothetical protein